MKDVKPLVSIIVPLHNAEKTIIDALNSCLNQEYKNIEIVVIENGSIDNSIEKVNTFKADNIKLYSIGKGSSTIARNIGFEKSNGDFIQYLDADDILSSNKIVNQINLIKNHPAGSLVCCGWAKFKETIVDVRKVPQKVWNDYNRPIEWLLDAWNGGGMMQTACWLTPRKLIEAAGPWEESFEQNPNDDGEFFCRVVTKAKKIVFDSESLVYYRIPTDSNVSQNKNRIAANSLLSSYYSYKQTVLEIEETNRVKMALGNNYLNFMYQYHSLYPDLTLKAEAYFNELQLKHMWPVGGSLFKKLVKVVGFKNALYLKKIVLDIWI